MDNSTDVGLTVGDGDPTIRTPGQEELADDLKKASAQWAVQIMRMLDEKNLMLDVQGGLEMGYIFGRICSAGRLDFSVAEEVLESLAKEKPEW